MSDKKLFADRNATIMGVIIGIVIGVLMSLAVVWYIAENNNSFQTRKVTNEAPVPAEPLALPGKPGDKPINPNDQTFDFYKTLPNDNSSPAASSTTPPAAAPANIQPQSQQNPAAAAKPTTANPPVGAPVTKNPSVIPPPAGNNNMIYLQAGAFEDEKRADALRATLALSQLESRIKAERIAGRGLVYRVQLGPYDNAAAANVKRQLEDQGLHPVMVRDN